MTNAQVIICKCGVLFAACMEPMCYQDRDWMKDVREYSKNGCSVEILNPQEVRVQIGACDCDKQNGCKPKEKKEEIKFDPNQLTFNL